MKKKKKVFQGALSTIFILFVVVMFLSLILSLIGFESYETYISNGVLESSLITVKNIFSVEGIKYLFKIKLLQQIRPIQMLSC